MNRSPGVRCPSGFSPFWAESFQHRRRHAFCRARQPLSNYVCVSVILNWFAFRLSLQVFLPRPIAVSVMLPESGCFRARRDPENTPDATGTATDDRRVPNALFSHHHSLLSDLLPPFTTFISPKEHY